VLFWRMVRNESQPADRVEAIYLRHDVLLRKRTSCLEAGHLQIDDFILEQLTQPIYRFGVCHGFRV